MEEYYEFGPVNIGKPNIWLRFVFINNRVEKILAQERGKVFQDVELSPDEMELARVLCIAQAEYREAEYLQVVNDVELKEKIQSILESLPERNDKIKGLEEFRRATQEFLGVLNG